MSSEGVCRSRTHGTGSATWLRAHSAGLVAGVMIQSALSMIPGLLPVNNKTANARVSPWVTTAWFLRVSIKLKNASTLEITLSEVSFVSRSVSRSLVLTGA